VSLPKLSAQNLPREAFHITLDGAITQQIHQCEMQVQQATPFRQ